MIPIGSTPETESTTVLEAWAIVQGSDRSAANLARLQELQDGAIGADAGKIARLIEAFAAGGGTALA